MARKGWYEALTSALQKENQAVMQFCTTEAPNRPHVRSLIHRAFITASAYPTLPLIVSTTDVRAPKVMQMVANNIIEAVYWTPGTQEQYRILGRAWIVPEVGYSGSYPKPRGVVHDALNNESFDWEAKRVAVFDQMSGQLKATWCRPVSGTPLKDGEDEMKKWPVKLPKLGEAENEEERKQLEIALSNFALLIVEPFEVDYLELQVRDKPDRRTKFQRDWEDERLIEFKETLVVP